MQIKSLPRDLTALIHYVELSKAGWRERAQELVLLSILHEIGGPADQDAIGQSANGRLPAPWLKGRVEATLTSLAGSGKVVLLPDGRVKLAESTSSELALQADKMAAMENHVKTVFDKIFSALSDEPLFSWDDFQAGLLVPLVTELGARTYELLSGERVAIDQAQSRADFLDSLTDTDRALAAKGINAFISGRDAEVRRYVLTLLNTAFLIQAISISETALKRVEACQGGKLQFLTFVDTNFLFSLIGLHENPSDDVVEALRHVIGQLADRVEVKLYILPITMDETRRTIAGYQQSLSGFRLLQNVAEAAHRKLGMLSGITAKFIEAGAKGSSPLSAEEYFKPYQDGLLHVCRANGVELYNAPMESLGMDPAVIDDVHEQLKFEERTRPADRRKSYDNLLHDVELWHFTKRKRPASVKSPLEAGYWVATIDSRLLGFDRYKLRHEQDYPPVCIHPTALLQVLQLWIPRDETLDAALMASLGPLLPHHFDEKAERITIKILRTISRFETAGDLSVDTIERIVADDVVRSRMGAAKAVEQEVQIIESALSEENRRLQADAKALQEEKEALRRQVVDREQEIQTLKLALTQSRMEGDARTSNKESLEEKLSKERSEREVLVRRLEQIEATHALEKSWKRLTVVGWALAVLLVLLISFVTPLSVHYNSTYAPWTQWTASVLLGAGLLTGVLAWKASRDSRLRGTRGAKLLATVTKFIWGTVILGLIMNIVGSLIASARLTGH